ncbi:MAG TPA: hypothetical protein ENI73_00155 [Spirochaetes bacterium]|nr:hypothetical protein [Spirochaetota bacterium]
MKQRRFDYKVNKNTQNTPSPRHSKTKSDFSEKRGLQIIIISFIALTIASYYILDRVRPETPPSHQKEGHNIPDLSHFLIMNKANGESKSLHSVVMVTYHRHTHLTLLSYFPSGLALDGKISINQHYRENGAKRVVKEFQDHFKLTFLFLTLHDSFYQKMSQELKSVKVYARNTNNLIVPFQLLDKINDGSKLYLAQGKNLVKYLLFDQKTNNSKTIEKKKVLLLHTLMGLLSEGEALAKALKGASITKRDVGETNIPANQFKSYQEALLKVKLLNVYTYPYRFKKKNSLFLLKENPSDNYLKLIKSIQNRYNRGSPYTAKDYLNELQSLDFIPSNKKIVVNVVDFSGRRNQYSSALRSYFNSHNLKILYSQGRRNQTIEKSYLIDVGHNLEKLNYVKGVLRVSKVYNSVDQKNESIDLIFMMGKDFNVSSGNS